MDLLLQAVSMAGAGLILAAFFSLQRGWWTSHGLPYLWSNFVGAVLLATVAIYDRRAGFIVLETAWAIVSLWGFRLRRSQPESGSP